MTTHFPKEIFTNIMKYCGDSDRTKHKKIWSTISIDREEYLNKDNKPYRIIFNICESGDRYNTYPIIQYHGEEDLTNELEKIDIFKEWRENDNISNARDYSSDIYDNILVN